MSADIAEVLRARGHRVTRPAGRVEGAGGRLRPPHGQGAHPPRVREHELGVNTASAYRSLALFSDLDLVRESRLRGDEAGRWEMAHPDDHFHVVCEQCGQVDHHVGDLVEQIRDHLDTGHGFRTATVELTVTGRCARCAGPGRLAWSSPFGIDYARRRSVTEEHPHAEPHAHEHPHDDTVHEHVHAEHDHEHIEHEHEHGHDGVTHEHGHVHQRELTDDHEHGHE